MVTMPAQWTNASTDSVLSTEEMSQGVGKIANIFQIERPKYVTLRIVALAPGLLETVQIASRAESRCARATGGGLRPDPSRMKSLTHQRCGRLIHFHQFPRF